MDNSKLAYPAYEVFFDIEGLMSNLIHYPKFKEKLDKYIDHHVPIKTKFIIYLPDRASKKVADYVYNKIRPQLSATNDITLINQNDLVRDDEFWKYKDPAVAVIISGSIVGGSRLLYLSRELRSAIHLTLVYFCVFSRTENESYLTFLKNNLVLGKFQNTFITVENVYVPKKKVNTPWTVEEDFLQRICEFCLDYKPSGFNDAISYFEARLEILEEGYKNRGLCDTLFYSNALAGNREMEINNNFAFFEFQGYHGNASQADIYFTIAVIINNLRNCTDTSRRLTNSQFSRSILEADNFNRYNDGIIQAAILRAAHRTELSYHLDENESYRMLSILLAIIRSCEQKHGESLLEFLYALAIGKMKMKTIHLKEFITSIGEHPVAKSAPVLNAFAKYITVLHLEKRTPEVERYEVKLDRV